MRFTTRSIFNFSNLTKIRFLVNQGKTFFLEKKVTAFFHPKKTIWSKKGTGGGAQRRRECRLGGDRKRGDEPPWLPLFFVCAPVFFAVSRVAR